MPESTAEKFCILGAGTSGLAAAKNFLQEGIPFDCLEREDNIGGNWYYGKPGSSVYQSTHLISSKRQTEYTDFPMPEHFPEYPNQRLVWEYLCDYAQTFGLLDHIQFDATVSRVEPIEEGWQVSLAGGEQRTYRGLVIANGHNWAPRWPDYRGDFSGRVIHSAEYKTPDLFQGRRVLVVGGGNSGCDIAVEAAIHAQRAIHSVRRGYHYLPKFFKGKPIDQCGEWMLALRLPLWLRRMSAALAIRWVLGPAELAGLTRPDHKLFESHPIINSQIHHHVGHGSLLVRPDIVELRGDRVRFVDDSEEPVDVIIYATGYHIRFPFIDEQYLNWQDGGPGLFLNIFHPQRHNLFCLGLIQPDSGQWGLVDYQAQLVARVIRQREEGKPKATWFDRLKQSEQPSLSGGIRYLNTARHRLEVEHFSYRRRLRKLIAKLN